jgi:predicted metalloprotease
MLWRGGRRSDNIEDRRGEGFTPGGGGGRFPIGGRAGGIGGLGLIALVLIGLFFGIDPSALLQGGGGAPSTYVPSPQEQARGTPGAPSPRQGPAVGDEAGQFVAVVLADTEDTWNALFQKMGKNYREPSLVLFSGAVNSSCRFAQAASGPFYCPRDHKIYLDTSFFNELSRRFGAPGDFAQAYVIAHEVGHHVQNQLGILPQVEAFQRQANRSEANQVQVMVELQADCFAGIWAHHADRSRGLLEKGDIEEGLNAAAAIGDDRLQKQTQGYVVPDAFTHGSAAQRVRWFKRGFESGQPSACDTFNADRL